MNNFKQMGESPAVAVLLTECLQGILELNNRVDYVGKRGDISSIAQQALELLYTPTPPSAGHIEQPLTMVESITLNDFASIPCTHCGRKVHFASHKPQRITEQDAREMAIDCIAWVDGFNTESATAFVNDWLPNEGRILLAKLNEHREPDYRAHAVEWVEIDNAEDAPTDGNLVLWDGCDLSIDYVENEVEYGTSFFANGTNATHYLKGIILPKESNDE